MPFPKIRKGYIGAAVFSGGGLLITSFDSLQLTTDPVVPPFFKHILLVCLIYSTAALSLNFVSGYIGQVSLGHAAFFGMGAYESAISTQLWGRACVPAFRWGVSGASLRGKPLGAPALRVRGPFLVVV